MIKHIVMLNIKEGVDGRSRADSIAEAKRRLEDMNGKIPGLIRVEVGVDFLATEASADMVIYAKLESREALAVYTDHPVHLQVLTFLKTIISERKLVDYVI